jgi:hypothetical protein
MRLLSASPILLAPPESYALRSTIRRPTHLLRDARLHPMQGVPRVMQGVMQGDIQGPPYLMPDNVELAFLRKFIERQSAGIPHNPRLRRFTTSTQ